MSPIPEQRHDERTFTEWRDDLAAVFEQHADSTESRAAIRPALKRRAQVLRMLAMVLRVFE